MELHKDLTGNDLHVNKLHADTHLLGGTDPLTLAGLGANDTTGIVFCNAHTHPDDAIATIGDDDKTLIVTDTEICDTSFTVPENVSVWFGRGGKWTINTGITVTFYGHIDAGLWQIFNCVGTGVAVFKSGSIEEVYPEWWGAIADTTTDNAAIFNSVIAQLNGSDVKTMVLCGGYYMVTETIVLFQRISIVGKTNSPSRYGQTRIYFNPASEKDLFDLYTNAVSGEYLYWVHLGNMLLQGNTVDGGTFSRYAINSKAAQSVFDNITICKFQDGVYCNYEMTNKYRDVYISLCSHAGIYTSMDASTTDTFDKVIIRETPWGAILRFAHGFTFIDCLFEALSTGGVNIYKECGKVDFISGYAENAPNAAAGDAYGMFYINHDGETLNAVNKLLIYGGIWHGTHGSFLDVDVTGPFGQVSVENAFISTYVNGIKCSSNTAYGSMYLSGNKMVTVAQPYLNLLNEMLRASDVFRISPWVLGAGAGSANILSANQSDADTDTTGMGSVGILTRTTTVGEFYAGIAGFKSVATATEPQLILTSTRPAVTAGKYYCFSACAKHSTTKNWYARIVWYDASDNLLSIAYMPSVPASALFSRISAAGQAPLNAATASLHVCVDAAVAGDILYESNLMFEVIDMSLMSGEYKLY